MNDTVNVWVDPVCPWTWLTTRWLREVERVRPVEARFHPMSLSVLNEGRDDVDDFYCEGIARWWGPIRVVVAATMSTGGDEVVGPLYEALGSRIHVGHEPYGPPLYEAALAEVGQPAELAAAAVDPAYDDEVRARHGLAALTAEDATLGVPTLHLPGPDGKPVAFLGPVVNPAPKGEDAGRLWDALRVVAATPGFAELKRSREPEPIVD